MYMKNLVAFSWGLTMTAFLVTSCGNKSSAQKTSPESGTSEKTAAAVPRPTLDIIIGGPFVFVQGVTCPTQTSPCLAVWVPNVKGHTAVIGLADQAQFKQFDSGDYDFTSGIHRSDTTTLVTPVQNASIYTASMKAQNLASTPKKKPFATLLMPNPREIVSWNADPMTISSNGSPVATKPTDNIATLTILRYDYQQGDTLEIKSGSETFWKPQPLTLGTERVVIIGFIPQNPTANEDEHTHALEAFRATTAILGLKWKITFNTPAANFQRNRPLDPNWPLPQDLLNLIDQVSTKDTKAAAAPVSTMDFRLFGKINDCKAPAILVTP
jgi:hypothetical protein